MRILWSDIMPGEGLWHIVRSELRRGDGRRHDHDFFELFWVEKGRGRHRIGTSDLPLEPGQLWFVSPCDQHQLVADRRLGLTIVNLALEAGHMRDLQRRYGTDLAWPWAADRHRARQLSDEDVRRLQRDAERLSGMNQQPWVVDGFMLNLFVLLDTSGATAVGLMQGRQDGESGPPRQPPAWLVDALTEFETGDTLGGGAREFARLAGRTPEHVNRTVRAVFGCDTTTKLNELRMRRAGVLLRMSNAAIIEIADRCGYASLTHFYNRFRVHYGTTPRRYRLRAKRPVSRSGP